MPRTPRRAIPLRARRLPVQNTHSKQWTRKLRPAADELPLSTCLSTGNEIADAGRSGLRPSTIQRWPLKGWSIGYLGDQHWNVPVAPELWPHREETAAPTPP